MDSQRTIYVVGYPSPYGGADTELDHQITLWTRHGWEVHLVPPEGLNLGGRETVIVDSVNERGCICHEFDVDLFENKLIVAFCNDGMLQRLPEIMLSGRPRAVVWANCMTWPMEPEQRCQRLGLIDYHIFQSKYQRQKLTAELAPSGQKVNVLEGYVPWLDVSRFPMRHKEPANYFGIGRVSRDDAAKYQPDLWRAYAQVVAPQPVKSFILGFGDNAKSVCGMPEEHANWLDYAIWEPCGCSAQHFFDQIHVLLHLTGGSRENWPRCVLEAWANGVVPVVEKDFGVAEMVEDGVNGFLVRSSGEAVYRASQLAFDSELRRKMVEAGFEALRSTHADDDAAITVWNDLYDRLFERTQIPDFEPHAGTDAETTLKAC